MHPAFYQWFKSVRGASGCGPWGGGCAPDTGGGYNAASDGDFGGAFGVRRPLRFLAYKLELNEQQMGELARIIDELKTERAQAAVDGRRTIAAFADALGGATFDADKANEAAAQRVKSAERLRDAVLKALGRIHAILNDEQRTKLAYLVRAGALTI